MDNALGRMGLGAAALGLAGMIYSTSFVLKTNEESATLRHTSDNSVVLRQYFTAQGQAQSAKERAGYEAKKLNKYLEGISSSLENLARDNGTISAIQEAQKEYALAKETEQSLANTPDVLTYETKNKVIQKKYDFYSLFGMASQVVSMAGGIIFIFTRRSHKKEKGNIAQTTPNSA